MTRRRSSTRSAHHEPVPGPTGGTHYSGDHLQALCRQIARTRLREGIDAPSTPDSVDLAIEQYMDKPKLTTSEEFVVATHEAGHAVTALACKHAPPIDRISIRGDIGGALGFVKHADRRTATSSRTPSCATRSARCSAAARPGASARGHLRRLGERHPPRHGDRVRSSGRRRGTTTPASRADAPQGHAGVRACAVARRPGVNMILDAERRRAQLLETHRLLLTLRDR
jgi:hypothetical protein